jgi:hypothetical protein
LRHFQDQFRECPEIKAAIDGLVEVVKKFGFR